MNRDDDYKLIEEHLGLKRYGDDCVIDNRTGRFTDAERYFALLDAARAHKAPAPVARVLDDEEEETVDLGLVDWIGRRALKAGTLLYAAPRAADPMVDQAERDAVNARRYGYLRNLPKHSPIPGLDVAYWKESYDGEPMRGEELDATIDGALAVAAGGSA
jgi:hypothetical protein